MTEGKESAEAIFIHCTSNKVPTCLHPTPVRVLTVYTRCLQVPTTAYTCRHL